LPNDCPIVRDRARRNDRLHRRASIASLPASPRTVAHALSRFERAWRSDASVAGATRRKKIVRDARKKQKNVGRDDARDKKSRMSGPTRFVGKR
jgi:hypothetical protein